MEYPRFKSPFPPVFELESPSGHLLVQCMGISDEDQEANGPLFGEPFEDILNSSQWSEVRFYMTLACTVTLIFALMFERLAPMFPIYHGIADFAVAVTASTLFLTVGEATSSIHLWIFNSQALTGRSSETAKAHRG
eukprot:TRINITY_DN17029_c0_g1_i1.p1 TRINITY_DN17029_c0_g1~~TRINITY_DN17029_c0_g1_i1.p1  ORF type:complete len:145 (+),score=22.91 TRINITY_DN17029_c0_g1_i1:29-436(+)